MLCAAPTVLIGIANAPAEARAGAPRGVRVVDGRRAAGGGDDRAHRGRARLDDHAGLRPDRDRAVHHRLRAAPGARRASRAAERAVVKARQGVELLTSGELRVVDDEGREVPRDGATVGEIVVRGNVVMKGYYNDPEATAQAMRGGWFHTGDAAVVHPDGYVEIRDRIKDVIISGGENISSVEVEGVLLRHPAVQEAAVVGLPDERWGEAPHAFVVLKPGATAGRRRAARVRARAPRALQGAARAARSSPSCRRRRPARSRSSCCAGGGRRISAPVRGVAGGGAGIGNLGSFTPAASKGDRASGRTGTRDRRHREPPPAGQPELRRRGGSEKRHDQHDRAGPRERARSDSAR